MSGKRLSFILSDKAHAELSEISTRTRRSMTDIMRIGLGLGKLAFEAEQRGERIIVTDTDGKPIKEIVLPESTH